jgi:hypothetical protein
MRTLGLTVVIGDPFLTPKITRIPRSEIVSACVEAEKDTNSLYLNHESAPVSCIGRASRPSAVQRGDGSSRVKNTQCRTMATPIFTIARGGNDLWRGRADAGHGPGGHRARQAGAGCQLACLATPA